MSQGNDGVLVVSLFSMSVLGVIAAFQMDVFSHLPDPANRAFDADRVHGSQAAYAFFGIPDGLLGMANYATTAALAGVGSHRILAGKTTFDLFAAASFGVYGWRRLHALSLYSLLVGAASAVSFLLAACDRS